MDGSVVQAAMADAMPEAPARSMEVMAQRLDAFAKKISVTRKEAIDGRAQTGIEQEWTEDQEAYDGIDDANRDEYKNVRHSKGDPLNTTVATNAAGDTRSTVLPNITGPYVDAAAARLADMLLPSEEQSFEINPTPIPDLVKLAELADPTPMTVAGAGGAGVQTSRGEFAKQQLEAAKEKAKKAETRIFDWLEECKYSLAGREVIEDAARLGTGVLKGPEPIECKKVAWVKDPATGFDEMEVRSEIRPASRRIDVWNCFPDPACGESIRDGAFHWEMDTLTKRRLLDLKAVPGYLADQIDLCVSEGPQSTEPYWLTPGGEPQALRDKNNYQLWHYYGTCDKEDYIAAQPYEEPEDGSDFYAQFDDLPDEVHIVATVVNHRIIRLKRNPLASGEFPYDYMVWAKRPGLPYGRGVARQIRTPQRMLTAATRNMMDNAGLGGGPILIIDTSVIEPVAGDDWTIYARKVFLKKEGATMADAKSAVHDITIEIVVEKLMQIIQFALRMAEECTGLPMILQGQMGEKNTTDRVGVAVLLNNNGSTVLRRLARWFDDRLTKPHIDRYYQWLMQRSDDPEEKGDFQIIPKGSSALIERGLQNQELTNLLPLSLDIRYELDPAKAAEEYLRSRHFDPKRFKMDPEKLKRVAAQQDPLAQAEAELKRADAILRGAQARKVAAEAIAVGVRTQYEAIQGGQVIVAVPGVAPTADVLVKNAADGLDATDQLPEPAGPAPASITAEDLLNRRTGMRVAQNGVQTSPNLPPVPQSPGAGVAAGVETPEGDGVR